MFQLSISHFSYDLSEFVYIKKILTRHEKEV